MRWRGRRVSRNVEDRRGMGGGAAGAGIGGVGVLAVVAIGWLLGVDVRPILGLLDGGGGGVAQQQAPRGSNRIDDAEEEFVAVVLADTEAVWGDIFERSGLTYREPTLVLFAGRTTSACGAASAATGPFYCPADQRIFLDMGFFDVMEQRLGARGDFGKAYVIAHEVAHHVQNQLGTLGEVNRLRARAGEVQSNRLSVRIELQADCYAGIWARAVGERFGVLDSGDIDEALAVAAAIGDDALQRAARGVVVPDSFTHGTSDQRQRWFYRGYESGDPGRCDTFAADTL